MPALDAKPKLYPDLVPVWNAFQELSSARHVGMGGASAIPPSDIAAYLDLIGIHDGESRSLWFRLLRGMDDALLKASRKKQENHG